MFKHILILISITLINLSCYAGKHIHLRINDSYGPFEYLNKDGVPIGFTVEVFNAIDHVNHLDYSIKTDNEIFNFYTSEIDSFDVVTSMDVLPANGKYISSEPFLYVDNHIITRIYSDIHDWESMNGKNVMILKDSSLIKQFEKLNIKANFTFIENIPQSFKLLSSGDLDAIVISNAVAHYYIKKLQIRDLSIKPLLSKPLPVRFYMLDSPQNRRVINKIDNALQTIKVNGRYDLIYSGRFYNNESESIDLFELLLIIVSASIMMSLIFGILYINWLYQCEKKKRIIKKQDEMPLLASLGKFINSSPIPILYFDIFGHIKYINRAGYKFSHKVSSDTYPYTIFNHTVLNDKLIDELKSGKPINFTYNLLSKEDIFNHLGGYVLPKNKMYNIFMVPVKSNNLVINGYVTYIFDITSQHNSEYDNIKYTTSLSQISDNMFLDICYYDVENNSFFKFHKNKAYDTGVSYEESLTYIHPLSRSLYIDEFLSILGGIKGSAILTIKKRNKKTNKYNTCVLYFNAIRADANTTLGIAFITLSSKNNRVLYNKHQELQNDLDFLLSSTGYQFLEFNLINGTFIVNTADKIRKEFSSERLFALIHPDDCGKVNELIENLKLYKQTNSYIVFRFFNVDKNKYCFYSVNLHSCHLDNNPRDKVIGVYQDISNRVEQFRDLEEFKECTTLLCEKNNIGIFEYCLTDYEHIYIPYVFTEKYGIDDDNFKDFMDDTSRNIFKSLIEKFNDKIDEINCESIKILSPALNKWVYFRLNIVPVRDDMNQEIYKYVGFMIEIQNS